jgi:hypothetical protein
VAHCLGITALLLLIVVALTGGIIWYNSLKTTELMVAADERADRLSASLAIACFGVHSC